MLFGKSQRSEVWKLLLRLTPLFYFIIYLKRLYKWFTYLFKFVKSYGAAIVYLYMGTLLPI